MGSSRLLVTLLPVHDPTLRWGRDWSSGECCEGCGGPNRPVGRVECQLLDERSVVLALRPRETWRGAALGWFR